MNYLAEWDRDSYLSLIGNGPKRIPHWENLSCPAGETYLTGIDFYEHPRMCRTKLAELYPELALPIPDEDDPLPNPEEMQTSVVRDERGRHTRWGAGLTDTWDHGTRFRTAEDVFSFSPLEQGDLTGFVSSEGRDYRDEETIYNDIRQNFPADWKDKAPKESSVLQGFYSTMFMWPLLTFGWELFLETCLDPRFERIMNEFAEINRRAFRAIARLPVNFVRCHDDVATSRGPVCSPEWMHKYIFPQYEEYWGILNAAGKKVFFQSDGCVDAFVDDVMACGAIGFFTEPYTDFKAIARRYQNCFLVGEGDNRVLLRNNPVEIRAMVESMVETGRMSAGYIMGIGNHIPWNTPPEALKLYLDYSRELAIR